MFKASRDLHNVHPGDTDGRNLCSTTWAFIWLVLLRKLYRCIKVVFLIISLGTKSRRIYILNEMGIQQMITLSSSLGAQAWSPDPYLGNSMEGTGILSEGHLLRVSWSGWSVSWASREQKNSRNRQHFSSLECCVGKRPSCTLPPILPCAGFPRKKTWVRVWGGSQSTFQQVFLWRWLAPSLDASVDNQLRWSKGSSAFKVALVPY